MNLKELLTTYYPQIILVLGGFWSLIFYFIKRNFDLKSKKIEIKYTLFQQNRINAIQEFLSSYKNIEHVYNEIDYYRIENEKCDEKEFDFKFQPLFNKFREAYSNLYFYFNPEEREDFKKIYLAVFDAYSLVLTTAINPPETKIKLPRDLGLEVLIEFISPNEQRLHRIGHYMRIEYSK